MASFRMLRRGELVITDVSGELRASIIRVARIGELGTTLAVSMRRLLVTANVVRLEVFAAVTMNNGVFWDVTTCGSCKNRRFGGAWFLRNVGSYKSRTA
jgi:hypothetical protein